MPSYVLLLLLTRSTWPTDDADSELPCMQHIDFTSATQVPERTVNDGTA